MTPRTPVILIAALVPAAAHGQLPLRVDIQPVVLQNPSGLDISPLVPPASDATLAGGSTFVIEIWAEQVTLHPLACGLGSLYADLTFDNAAMTCVSVTVAPTFDNFGAASGVCDNPAGVVDEVGGVAFIQLVGLFDEWARVATVTMTADAMSTGNVILSDPADDLPTHALIQCGGVAPNEVNYLSSPAFEIGCAGNADCDDGDACNGAEICSAGVCSPGTPLTCNDTNLCTDDACDPQSGCVFTANTNGCDDDDLCTTGDICSNGTCAGVPVDCSHLTDQCNVGVCNVVTGECVAQQIGGACDDGQACTEGDTCLAGTCVGAPVDCSHLNDDCSTGGCNPVTGQCEALPINEGGTCEDGDLCTLGDVCSNGTCLPGTPPDCSGLNDQCIVGQCNPVTGGCEPQPISGPCEDGEPCTENDMCLAGSCVPGLQKDCTALDVPPCIVGVCTPGTGVCAPLPINEGVTCDDGDACTESDACTSGVCAGTPVNCDDGLFCTGVESCDTGLGCQSGSFPCQASEWCAETTDLCFPHGDGDFNSDLDVDLGDFGNFQVCFDQPVSPGCEPGNMTGIDEMVDLDDAAAFVAALGGP